MEYPKTEITPIIHLLTQSPPSLQRQTIERYFARDASFIHPFCRTGSFDFRTGIKVGPFADPDRYTSSRFLIVAIYRWYKIMSPKIELEVDSVAFDETNLILYVSLHQIFKLFFFPRFLATRAELIVRLRLKRGNETGNSSDDSKYYIIEQNDLYQVNEFMKFADPLGILWAIVIFWHYTATIFCLFAQWTFAPISWWEETRPGRNLETGTQIQRREQNSAIEKVD